MKGITLKAIDKDGTEASALVVLDPTYSNKNIDLDVTGLVEGGLKIQIWAEGKGIVQEYVLCWEDLEDTIYPSPCGGMYAFDDNAPANPIRAHWAYKWVDATVLKFEIYGYQE